MSGPVGDWHDFYLGTLSASAALMGLLFVAISLHLRVLAGPAHPVLRAEARTVYLGYLGPLVTSILSLIPDQALRLLGLEMLAYGIGHLILLWQSTRESFGAEFRDTRRAVIFSWLFGGSIIVARWLATVGLLLEAEWGVRLLGLTVAGALVFSVYLTWDLVFRAARMAPEDVVS